MIYIITGLINEEDKPIHYVQVKTNIDCLKEVAKAFDKGAKLINIRRIG